MKVSKNWVSEYIDIKELNYSDITEKMLLAGNEYAYSKKLSDSSNLVIGYIIDQKQHPEADKLNVCLVDLGNGVETQIVCGAPNVSKGQKVIVAKVGATLPGNIKIGVANIKGIESNGMICSLEELGIESKYVPERSKGGIHVLDDDAPIGEDALHYLGFDDIVTEYELTSNRSDLMSILGMAYEIGAVTNKKVEKPKFTVNEIADEASSYISIENQTDNAPVYLSRIVRDIVIKESPNFIKSRLIASGIRPINNVVDISNYVMLEYGNPLHFFDYDKLGSKIIVRMANNGEKVITLDGKERTLKDSDIVITTPNEIVALAGVMGGYNTEITEETKTILIESAVFNPVNIRRTSNEILRSEASVRFEKGIDSNYSKEALDRAAYLLEKYANGKILKGIVGYNHSANEPKNINITLDKINRVLGMKLNLDDVSAVFHRLDFAFELDNNTFKVIVPTRRLDINIEEDLIEEVGRIHGYDNMEGVLPKAILKRENNDPKYLFIKDLKNQLTGMGLNEIISYSLTNEENINKFTNDNFNKIVLSSPMSEERKIMRYSLLPSLVNVVLYNNARNIKDNMIYEIGSTYYQHENEYYEETKLGIAMVGTYLNNSWQNKNIEVDFYVIKGILDNIINYVGLSSRYSLETDNSIKEFHPKKSATILIDGEKVGYIGAIHPIISKLPIYLLEISLDKLMNRKIRKIKYKPVSIYPSVHKDVAFIIDKNIEAKELINVIKKSGGNLLSDINIFDIYNGQNIDEDKKSIALTLTFKDENKTLTDETVNVLFHKIIKDVETNLNGIVRDK